MRLPARYVVDGSLARAGGFGSALAVHDSYLDRDVLFKSMHDPENNLQLSQEIHGLSRARSRHVVEIYDVVKEGDGEIVGIIIEKLTGREYSEFYKDAPSNPSDFLRLVYQIATALRDLHKAGIVHRDIKLENIRESDSGILKIFDFGISCAGTGYHTRDNRGTLVYAAPELFIQGVKINTQMDIYALGVCCWALASKNWPAALLERPPQSSNRAPSIATLFPSIFPTEIVEVMDSCLDPTASQRPTADDVSRVLERYLVRENHRGIFVQDRSAIYELSSQKRNVTITIAPLGELRVSYNGLDFVVYQVTGSIFVNNVPAQVGMKLPDACVFTFGDFILGSSRSWVTFQSSYPEVVI